MKPDERVGRAGLDASKLSLRRLGKGLGAMNLIAFGLLALALLAGLFKHH